MTENNYDALLEEARANDDRFEFTIGEHTFHLRGRGLLTRDDLEAIERGTHFDALHVLMNDDDEWATFDELDVPLMVIADPPDSPSPERGILHDWQAWSGVSLGESRASRRSSKRTSRQSKSTSDRSTDSASPEPS